MTTPLPAWLGTTTDATLIFVTLALSSNIAISPIAKLVWTPLVVIQFGVLKSQLPLTYPLQINVTGGFVVRNRLIAWLLFKMYPWTFPGIDDISAAKKGEPFW